jgi:hypothetical protein
MVTVGGTLSTVRAKVTFPVSPLSSVPVTVTSWLSVGPSFVP